LLGIMTQLNMKGYSPMKNKLIITSVVAASVLLSACAPKLGGNDYSASSVGEMSQTYKGVIVSMRKVAINAGDASTPGVGALAGGLAGGALGQAAGGGRGRVITTVGGALLGAFAGHAVGQAATGQDGFEYSVKLANGDLVTVSQGADPVLAVGQSVLVIKSDRGRSRVVADHG
jgi:outer membrane lipoprotein SlyB